MTTAPNEDPRHGRAHGHVHVNIQGPPVIEARGVKVRLGETMVLRGVDLAVERGRMLALIGPNGSGKTTLLRSLVGLQALDAGRIRLFDQPLGPEVLARVGYVPQRLTIDSGLALTVGEFLMLKARGVGLGRHATARDARERVHKVAAEFGADAWMNRPLAGLSGGQRQRVLIAFSLLCDPEVLLLDEPTAGVDSPGEQSFYEMIAAARSRRSLTVVLVSHDLSMVHRHADWVVALNGVICCEGAPEDVMNTESLQRAYGLEVTPYRHDHHQGHNHGHVH
jgi:zinc transport system ATP-binding protein